MNQLTKIPKFYLGNVPIQSKNFSIMVALFIGILIGGSITINQLLNSQKETIPTINQNEEFTPGNTPVLDNQLQTESPDEDSENNSKSTAAQKGSGEPLIKCLGADNKYSFVTKIICDYVNNYWAAHKPISSSSNSSSSSSSNSSSSSSSSSSTATPTPETPPTFSSAEVGSVSNSTIAVTFSEAVTASGNDFSSGVTIEVNDVAATINSGTRQGNEAKVYYVLSAAIANGDTVTFAYTEASGYIVDVNEGAALENVTSQSVTNNVPAAQIKTLTAISNSKQYTYSNLRNY